ncbi:unnamed protein product [Orchesella dallaii]|uniref:Serine/threonine-protein phosphatase 2A regulatory subunit B'' subunit gamma n=1 Tax=Orchesella dallaii TaxID=48710 RepID=A0ABP1Q3F5_9HEXA
MCCSQNLCDYFISFEGYLKAIEQLRWIPFIPLWFTPKLFMRLAEKEMGGGVCISMFFEYAHKKLDNYRLRLDLFRIDENGKGYVTKEQNLWSYFCQTLNLDEWCCESNDGRKNQISSLYIQYLVSEMFFILDQHRTKKIKIVELLDSQLLQNITQKFSESVVFGRFMKKMSAFNAMSLDDVDGCIPVDCFCEKFPDFSQNIWGGSNNEKRFLDSFIHQLVKIYGDSTKEKGKINFDTFLNITFACENLDTSHNISSICYFFRVLDLDSKGYLDEMDLQFHYRNIQEYLEKKMSLSFKGLEQQRLANFKNIQSQFSDMLTGEGGLSHITPAKLWNTRSGFMLIEFLVDATQSLEKQDEEYPQMNTGSSFAANDLMTDGTHGHSSLTPCKENLESVNSIIDLSTHPHPPSHSSNTFKTEEGQGDVPKDSGVAGVAVL